ncbi:YwqG family protein [Veronia pacifica]|uniref:DUF1963 domain-containing protein n=1 Tax=Veronia pacifica TaxID=1080227 RepID=A0A1C3E535_9GAMM|nr:DUF1963 domain-containing protein [Veronia pacifica]ODA28357.1 hypothetical protein A8L45_23105 [Veronia pacifica]
MNSNEDKVVIPSVLKDFEDGLVKLQREYISVEAIPLNCKVSTDPLSLTRSKFLGFPFYPIDSEYPKDKAGSPMVLLAQINFSELPKLEGFPSSGLLQLFFPTDDWWDMDSGKIIFHKSSDLDKSPITDFSFIHENSYDELPINKIHEMVFKKAIDTGCSEDSQFSFMFGSKDYWDFEDSLNEIDKDEFDNYFSCTGHKIGGYADFTQGDPRDYSKQQKNDVQLLQIDVDDHIMFGDSGVGHIFINPEDLKVENFVNAYFYWDCC